MAAAENVPPSSFFSGLGGVDNQDWAAPGEDPAATDVKKAAAKPRNKSRRVTKDLLLSDNGLPKLNGIVRDKNSIKRTGNIKVDSMQLIQMYEGWAKQLLPTMDMAEFVQQIEKLSGNKDITVKMMHLEQGEGDDEFLNKGPDSAPQANTVAEDDWGGTASTPMQPAQPAQPAQSAAGSGPVWAVKCP
jgi:hypothetical protein